MTRRLALVLLILVLGGTLSGCRLPWTSSAAPPVPCDPPGGGRCAQDIAWNGPIYLTRDGMRLHEVIICGGVLHASETSDRVYIRLHLLAMGAGSMSCATVDVGVRLASPLGDRTVVDSVGHRVVRVVQGRPPDHLSR